MFVYIIVFLGFFFAGTRLAAYIVEHRLINLILAIGITGLVFVGTILYELYKAKK